MNWKSLLKLQNRSNFFPFAFPLAAILLFVSLSSFSQVDSCCGVPGSTGAPTLPGLPTTLPTLVPVTSPTNTPTPGPIPTSTPQTPTPSITFTPGDVILPTVLPTAIPTPTAFPTSLPVALGTFSLKSFVALPVSVIVTKDTGLKKKVYAESTKTTHQIPVDEAMLLLFSYDKEEYAAELTWSFQGTGTSTFNLSKNKSPLISKQLQLVNGQIISPLSDSGFIYKLDRGLKLSQLYHYDLKFANQTLQQEIVAKTDSGYLGDCLIGTDLPKPTQGKFRIEQTDSTGKRISLGAIVIDGGMSKFSMKHVVTIEDFKTWDDSQSQAINGISIAGLPENTVIGESAYPDQICNALGEKTKYTLKKFETGIDPTFTNRQISNQFTLETSKVPENRDRNYTLYRKKKGEDFIKVNEFNWKLISGAKQTFSFSDTLPMDQTGNPVLGEYQYELRNEVGTSLLSKKMTAAQKLRNTLELTLKPKVFNEPTTFDAKLKIDGYLRNDEDTLTAKLVSKTSSVPKEIVVFEIKNIPTGKVFEYAFTGKIESKLSEYGTYQLLLYRNQTELILTTEVKVETPSSSSWPFTSTPSPSPSPTTAWVKKEYEIEHPDPLKLKIENFKSVEDVQNLKVSFQSNLSISGYRSKEVRNFKAVLKKPNGTSEEKFLSRAGIGETDTVPFGFSQDRVYETSEFGDYTLSLFQINLDSTLSLLDQSTLAFTQPETVISDLRVYPNPISNGEPIHIGILTNEPLKVTFQLFDLNGKLVEEGEKEDYYYPRDSDFEWNRRKVSLPTAMHVLRLKVTGKYTGKTILKSVKLLNR